MRSASYLNASLRFLSGGVLRDWIPEHWGSVVLITLHIGRAGERRADRNVVPMLALFCGKTGDVHFCTGDTLGEIPPEKMKNPQGVMAAGT